jgi:hypothetical protein
MTDIVVLAEEPSGRIVAEQLVRKLGLGDRTIVLEHQGKSDLEQSFPRKIGHWRSPNPPRFVIMRDNDGADCLAKKDQLRRLVPPPTLPIASRYDLWSKNSRVGISAISTPLRTLAS